MNFQDSLSCSKQVTRRLPLDQGCVLMLESQCFELSFFSEPLIGQTCRRHKTLFTKLCKYSCKFFKWHKKKFKNFFLYSLNYFAWDFCPKLTLLWHKWTRVQLPLSDKIGIVCLQIIFIGFKLPKWGILKLFFYLLCHYDRLQSVQYAQYQYPQYPTYPHYPQYPICLSRIPILNSCIVWT